MRTKTLYLDFIENILKAPNEKELEEIYTKSAEDDTKCSDLYQWMPWNSVSNPTRYDGNDYETLQDHQIHFK